MRAYESSRFFSSLVALLSPLAAGVEYSTAPNTEGFAAEPATGVFFADDITQQPRSRALEEVHTGPDPFFADLVDRTPHAGIDVDDDGKSVSDKEPPPTYYVEVYENDYRGLGRRWREVRQGRSLANVRWSYKDGSAALPPVEVLPPDDWEWVSEWKIDGSGGRDTGGWEYTKEIGKFDASRVPRGKKRSDRFRRRRWVRSMRPQLEKQRQDLNEAGLQLESLSEAMGMGAPALHVHAYEYEPEDFRLDLGRDLDVDLFPAPDLHELQHGTGRISPNLPTFGPAVKAFKGWWTEEFTFRGFGIGFVKPLFRGMLLRPDIGVGIRLPLTLHFRSWERQEALPSVSASFFVLWPPAVQVSQAVSYPAELLQEWAATAARKIAVPSKEALQARERKESVQRLGVSAGVRYSATYGFQWWLAPYFFLLPGVRVMWHLYQSMMTMILSSLALMQRSDIRESWEGKNGKDETQQALWLLALRSWAAAKTSGLGYSLNYSGSRLGGAVMVNFMPFFLPAFSMKQLTSDADESAAVEEGIVENEVLEAATASEGDDRFPIEDVAGESVTDVVAEPDAKGAGQGGGAAMQACAA